MIENEDDITASALRRHTRARPDVGPGWREDSSETLYYSAAWLDVDEWAIIGYALRRPTAGEDEEWLILHMRDQKLAFEMRDGGWTLVELIQGRKL